MSTKSRKIKATDHDQVASDAELFSPERAGLLPDELRPGESGENTESDLDAVGTPAGGSAAGGLGGVNTGDGDPDNIELEGTMKTGYQDNSGDTGNDDQEPEAGISGGAVGGTPANKRATSHGQHGISGGDSGSDSTVGRKPR